MKKEDNIKRGLEGKGLIIKKTEEKPQKNCLGQIPNHPL